MSIRPLSVEIFDIQTSVTFAPKTPLGNLPDATNRNNSERIPALSAHSDLEAPRAAQKSHIFAALEICFYHVVKNHGSPSVNTLFTLLFQGKLSL